MEATLTVGQLARAADTTAVTIRYYEQLGLLPSATRNASGYRQYSAADCDRLLFIRRSRSLGFSLAISASCWGLPINAEPLVPLSMPKLPGNSNRCEHVSATCRAWSRSCNA